MDIKALVGKAKELENQSEVQAGGDFEYTPPKEGKTVGRLIEYIELGKHIEMFEGKPKPPADMVRITFELLGKNANREDFREVEINGQKKVVADRISWTGPRKFTEKAKYFKLFKAMAAGRAEITHMGEMLGEAFVLTVSHNTSGEGDKKRTYANLWKDGSWGVSAPRAEDPITGNVIDLTKVIPEPVSPIRIFIWDIPSKETWDTLFIDGENEIKEADGTTRKVSKNWLQEKIMSATDFGGSALEQMLAGLNDLPTQNSSAESKPQSEETKSAESSTNADAGTPTSATAEDDPQAALKALGL